MYKYLVLNNYSIFAVLTTTNTHVKKLLFLTFLCLIARFSFAQCSGFQIIADKSNICAPDIIRFQVLNPVAGSTYEWNVGNGIVFGADTLYSFFTTPGLINATVKITLPNGSVCNVTQNAIAEVNPIPVPIFSASEVKLCEGPDSVAFTDITLNSESRSWVVQGTNYSNTSATFKHAFVTSGLKKVSLIVTDSNGCKGVKEFSDTIEIYDDPAFSFSADRLSGCAPLDVNLTLSNNPNVGNFTKTYNWTFGGHSNTTDTKEVPTTRTYNTAGKYPVSLEVELSNGCTYSIEQNDTILVGDTVALGLSVDKDTVCAGELLTFSQTNTALSGNLGWTVTGVTREIVSSSNTQSIVRPTSRGNIRVILRYTENGCTSTKDFLQIARSNAVDANFNSDNNYHCLVPHTVDLDNTSNTLDANTLSYQWRVLDGATEVFTSTSEDPSFTFNTLPGLYNVELLAVGDNGCRDSITRNGFIYQDSMSVDFNVQPQVVCVGQEININNTTRPTTYTAVDSFEWSFFDTNGITILDSSEERSPTFSYDEAGFYDIQVVGHNLAGCTDTLRLDRIVEVIRTDLNYTLSDSILCRGVSFDLQGSSLPSNASFNYDWRFEHIGTPAVVSATGENASVRPTVIGEYRVIATHSIAGSCLISDTSYVHVNGTDANINLDTSGGCAPLQVNPTLNISNDYYYGASTPSYSYAWSTTPPVGVSISDNTSSTPLFDFSENGDYTIRVNLTNAANCTSTFSSSRILTGVRAGFQITDNRICKGDSLDILDNSRNGVTGVTWELTPQATFSLLPQGGNQLKIDVETPGSYTLQQVVTNNGDCFDTTTLAFEIIETIADFEAVDSFLQCAPIYAEFQSRSSNADTLIWDFGTGEEFKTLSSSAGTIYQRNSGWTDGYDITLIAKNREGCSDTSIRENYLVVAGPRPEFEMENFVGCEPLNVRFTDKSEDGQTFFLNYNDGSPLDSSKTGDFIGTRSYAVQAPLALRQTVMPNIIVYDSVGCAAVFEPLDSIIIYRKPSIQTTYQNGTDFCSPFNVVFEDTGRFTNTRNWYFDDVNISTAAIDSVVETAVGTHELKLISRNSNNCYDTLEQTIGVYETPVVSFTIPDTICINDLTQFVGEIQSTNPSNSFLWNFGEEGSVGNTNSTDLNPSFAYATRGSKTIKLIGGLTNGCSDSTERTINITDETDIDVPDLNYVSFLNNLELEVVYAESTEDKFRKYVISSSQGNVDIFDQKTLTHTAQFASSPTVTDCYSVLVGDYCDLLSDNSMQHCFIVLSVNSTLAYTNDLSWSPYVGWSAVDQYVVYRKDANDVFVQIATLDGNTTTYQDTRLCDQEYEYYVSAIHPTQNWESKSYSVIQRPVFLPNERLSSVKNVTVNNDAEIEVHWQKSDYSEFSNYKLLKYENSFDNFVDEIDLDDTTYIDNDVNTNEISYIYQVLEVDRCGDVNVADKEGKSILLKGEYNDGSSLYWTKYENWESGVKEYNVEINKLTGFEFRHRNDWHDRDFIDKKLYRDILGEYCYRVYGVSHTGDTSYSNTTCLSGDPKLFIPTAFSPNNDGLNDLFNPIMFFMKEGELEEVNGFSLIIFNRWGEKVFETDDPRLGWNGTYKGTECQQGAYVYKVKATGLDNFKIYESGSITIVR